MRWYAVWKPGCVVRLVITTKSSWVRMYWLKITENGSSLIFSPGPVSLSKNKQKQNRGSCFYFAATLYSHFDPFPSNLRSFNVEDESDVCRLLIVCWWGDLTSEKWFSPFIVLYCKIHWCHAEVTWQRSGTSKKWFNKSGGASSALSADGQTDQLCYYWSFWLCAGLSTARDACNGLKEIPAVQGHFSHVLWCDGSNHPLLQCWHRAGTQCGCLAVLLDCFFLCSTSSPNSKTQSWINEKRDFHGHYSLLNIYNASFYVLHWGKMTQWASCKHAHTGLVTCSVAAMFLSAQI